MLIMVAMVSIITIKIQIALQVCFSHSYIIQVHYLYVFVMHKTLL